MAQTVKRLPAMQETWVRSLGREDPLEKEMATHSSTLAMGKSHGQRRLVGYSPRGREESNMTEQLRLHFQWPNSTVGPVGYCDKRVNHESIRETPVKQGRRNYHYRASLFTDTETEAHAGQSWALEMGLPVPRTHVPMGPDL